MPDEVKLEPCPVPWCRGEADADWYAVGEQDRPYWVRCKTCGCKTPSQYSTVAEAIAAWNTRAAIEATRPTAAATDDVVKELVEALEHAEHVFRCYADMHDQKGTNEGRTKAKRNIEHAERMAAALARTGVTLNG